MQPFQRLKQESNLKQARHPPSPLPTISNEFQPTKRRTHSREEEYIIYSQISNQKDLLRSVIQLKASCLRPYLFPPSLFTTNFKDKKSTCKGGREYIIYKDSNVKRESRSRPQLGCKIFDFSFLEWPWKKVG
jgi:hypothetical protein